MANKKPANRRTRNRTGAAAVEFSISITILLLVVFASIEFVRLNMLKHAVEHSSYLAARKGIIIGAKSADIKNTALAHLSLMSLSGASVAVSPNEIKDDTQIVEVTVDVPVSGNSWISPVYFGGTISGRTRMLAERTAADMASALPAGP